MDYNSAVICPCCFPPPRASFSKDPAKNLYGFVPLALRSMPVRPKPSWLRRPARRAMDIFRQFFPKSTKRTLRVEPEVTNGPYVEPVEDISFRTCSKCFGVVAPAYSECEYCSNSKQIGFSDDEVTLTRPCRPWMADGWKPDEHHTADMKSTEK